MKPVQQEWHNEDLIEEAARRWLETCGWKVDVRSSIVGADILAVDPKGRNWIFEVKGYPSTYYKNNGAPKSRQTIMTQRRVWFIEALGQIISRVKQPDHYLAVVFPDHSSDHFF